ncbi:hypothetical protein [Undibacterium terreum]|uniref:Uncharacterized protein n=1 Tax=Undibacterium terreum TaxID=1224302 RepID=A0A916UGL8_9BURK|nr:hypothetical protein [Undibacterium terreum]GGC72701.1 hypothetical protein GCM10011396_19860 [Undibacterium terreum]
MDEDRSTLHFNGDITRTNFLAMKSYLDHGISTVIVNSGGGDGEAGLAIGKEFRKRKITLIVEKYCLSSCANYLFLGAAKKILQPGAILGFHGGLTGGSAPTLQAADYPLLSESELATVRQQLLSLYKKETVFFHSIGFNPALLRISLDRTKLPQKNHSIQIVSEGKLSQFTLDQQDKAKEFMETLKAENKSYTYDVTSGDESPSKFYFPSKATMQQYGVSGILKYQYPANKGELETMAKNLADANSAELELVGDF